MYLWKCRNCEGEIEVLRSMSDYQRPPDETEVGEDEDCSHEFERLISGVNFLSTERHVGKTEFGKDRARQELIEAGKVEREMMNLPHDKRGEHKKKIKKLRSIEGDT
jgi:hypothetical protein